MKILTLLLALMAGSIATGAEVLFLHENTTTAACNSWNSEEPPSWKILDPENTDGDFTLRCGKIGPTSDYLAAGDSLVLLLASIQGCSTGPLVAGCPYLINSALPTIAIWLPVSAGAGGNLDLPLNGLDILGVGQAAFQVFGEHSPGQTFSTTVCTIYGANPPLYCN